MIKETKVSIAVCERESFVAWYVATSDIKTRRRMLNNFLIMNAITLNDYAKRFWKVESAICALFFLFRGQ